MVPLELLRALCAVVDHGSFAAAAEALGLTQPALSMQIARLEDEAGMKLFLRTGRRKVLGSEGLAVLARARRILAEVRGLEDDLAALQGLETGTLALAAGDTVLRHLLALPVAQFALQWPGIHVKLWNRPSGEALGLIREGRADLGILTLPVEASDLEVHPWREFTWVAAAPPPLWGGLPEGSLASVSDLAARTLVLLEPGTRVHGLWSRACLDRGLPLGPHLETGSVDIQLDLAARGVGIALVPDFALGPERPSLEVRRVEGLGTGTLTVVHRRGRRSRAAEAFLRASFPSLPPAV